MQETWWKWSRWKNYIKYEADILINQTKMSIEWKEKAKSYANQKDNEIWKIQSPYSWATIIRTIPLRFRLPNSLPPQKDDIWGSGRGGESPTKLKIGILSWAQQHTEWVRLVHCYFQTKILNRWYQIGVRKRMKNAHKKHKETLRWNTSKGIDLKALDYHRASLMSIFSDKTVTQHKQYT